MEQLNRKKRFNFSKLSLLYLYHSSYNKINEVIKLKKILILLLVLTSLMFVCSCGNEEDSPTLSVESENTQPVTETPKDDYDGYKNPFVQEETNYQHIELDKKVYSMTDDLVINIFNAESSDFVGVFDLDGEPGGVGTPHIKRNKVSGKTQMVFNIENMKLSPGEYNVYLYKSGNMFIYDRVPFKVWDGDVSDYGVESATLDFINNSMNRTSSLTITPSTAKELTYKFYWAKDGVRLDGYSYLEVLTKSSNEPFTVNFKDNMYMPREANQVEVYVLEGNSSSYFVNVDNNFKLEKSKYLFNFQVFSDVHSDVSQQSWNAHFQTALIDVMRLSGNSSGIVIVGDSTNFGSQTCYALLKDTINELLPTTGPKVYFAMGNHEYQYYNAKGFDVARDYFFEELGLNSIYYSFELNECKFIIMGSESLDKAGYMSNEQLTWFKNQMQNVDKNKPTFVFFHQPLGGTLSGMSSGLEPAGYPNVDKELRAILKDHPNTYVFNGHTHMTYETDKTAVFGKGKDANFVNTGSIAYLNDINYNEIVGSLGLFVEVYQDYIMINGRNFTNGEWVAEAAFVSPIYKVE